MTSPDSKQPAKRFQFSLLWLLCVAVPIAAVTALGVRTTLLLTGTIRPPRPMFCNHFLVQHEFQIFPAWEPSYYLYDERDRVGWVDFADNAILIVMPQASGRVGFYSLRPGVADSSVELDLDGQSVKKISRESNVLFVVLSDGDIRQFPIRDRVAEDYYHTNVFQQNTPCPDLLAAAEGCVREEYQADYRTILKAQ